MKRELVAIKAKIQKLLASPDYKPMRTSEVIALLKIPPSDRKLVKRAIDRLLQEGVIVHVRKDRLVLPSEADLVTGRIQMTDKGFGFVIPATPLPPHLPQTDIFIAAEDTWIAMHGDKVVARIHETAPSRKTPQQRNARSLCGRIIRILERANPTIVGVLQKSRNFHYVVPDDPRMIRDIYVDLSRTDLRPRTGDRVVVELDPWENRHVNPEGNIIECIGPSDDPKLDITVIIKKFRMPLEFPDEVMDEAREIEMTVSNEERQRRVDLSSETVITIDPDDARDYDDALSLKPSKNGGWTMGVHIADVSHYVRPGSLLDKEADKRGNSVYLPDRVIPMLPPELSNEICSLKQGVPRLTQSVFFEIGNDGQIQSYHFKDTVICSAARLTYHQALSVIQPQHPKILKNPIKDLAADHPIKNPEIQKLLVDLWELGSKVRKLRFQNGSLDLDFPELKVYCDANGLAERIEKQDTDPAHQLVEEFMLLANEAVAAEIQKSTLPCVYRIHEDPDLEKLDQYRELIMTYGYSMGDPTARGEIQRVLQKIRDKPEEYILKLAFLKSLKRAQYSTNPIGHFGLAKENYTHFTSPIRRYADLIVHRVLLRSTQTQRKELPAYKAKTFYNVSALEKIAAHCSSTERVADEAEKEAVRLKLIEYFERQLKEKNLDSFDAVITEVRNFGLFVELPDYMLSGLIHVSSLADDFYNFDPVRQNLKGKHSKRMFQAGSRVKVEVARVDRFKKQVDFRLTSEEYSN